MNPDDYDFGSGGHRGYESPEEKAKALREAAAEGVKYDVEVENAHATAYGTPQCWRND